MLPALKYIAVVIVLATEGVSVAVQSPPLSPPENGITKGEGSLGTEKPTTAKKDKDPPHNMTVIVNQESSLDTKADEKQAKENAEKERIQRDIAIFTGLLVIVGFLTCGLIFWQSWETRRAAEAARESSEATRKSVELQEVLNQQWLEFDNWKAVSGGTLEETNDVVWHLTFEIVNATKMPLTLNRFQIYVNDEKTSAEYRHTLPPGKRYVIPVDTLLKGAKARSYLAGKGILPINGSIGYCDAFGKQKEQSFSIVCFCGPPDRSVFYNQSR
jgi:hypothetical protein